VLTSSALVPLQVMTLFQNLTINIQGNATPVSPSDPLYTTVRLAWQTMGQPAFSLTTNVVFIWAKIVPRHAYGHIRDEQITVNNDASVVLNIGYTRVWEVRWMVYGPNCFDALRLVKDVLISCEWAKYIFEASNLYLDPENTDPRYVPEAVPIEGQWWQRADYIAHFNEKVSETLVTPSVASTEILLYDKNGLVAEINVNA
jgi:hypothetical protein